MKPVLHVSNLFVSYHGNDAIRNVNFSVKPGKLVGIIGPNGAGKSTLLKALLNLIPRDKGEVLFHGKSFADIRKSVAYLPQRSQIDWDFPINVLDTVIIGTYPGLGFFKKPRKKEKEWALQCLKEVGMDGFSKRQIGELSGGQQQRVFLARALAQKADIFFLDEPFVGVDVLSEETIIRILKKLTSMGKTIFVVHHDLSKANEYFDQLLLLNKELIQFGDANIVFQKEILARAYSGQFSFLEEMGVNA
ncbi:MULTISPECIES: metal ABC transporter ATP-binding protein [Bacillaceae]|uniref:Manganese transporter n=1 Tax=Domibacillus aminovorans TaxID=29332 RepID=A0A177KYJ3_9BACI|nr:MULTISPECIES: metal ABC transporter ATP-binding protein [Bacillaceae]OAH58479.1 manganese transporter [Domibacillus aminovorans]